jgi:hypothetical protein
MRALQPTQAVLLGTLTVGILDGLDAVVFFGLRGVSPIRIFQAIARGLLGREAFAGGAATALLGVGLHFVVACGIVTTYVAASRYLTVLARRPFMFGPLFGIAAYLVMTFVVVPLSAVTRGPLIWPVVTNGLLIHILGVGVPSALFARAARGASA